MQQLFFSHDQCAFTSFDCKEVGDHRAFSAYSNKRFIRAAAPGQASFPSWRSFVLIQIYNEKCRPSL
jgi:hypothetical protein